MWTLQKRFIGILGAAIFLLHIPLAAQLLFRSVALPDDKLTTGNIYSPQISIMEKYIVYERATADSIELIVLDRSINKIRKLTAIQRKEKEKKKSEGLIEDWINNVDEFTQLSIYEGEPSLRPVLDQNGKQWIVFVSSGADQEFDLYLADLDDPSGKVMRLPHQGMDRLPNWSPDGRRIVFVSKVNEQSDLFVAENMMDIINRRDPSLFKPAAVTKDNGLDLYPVWSPAGDAIAYQADVDENGINNSGIQVISVVNNMTYSKPLRLTADLAKFHENKPSWSPDGNYLAFYKTRRQIGQEKGTHLLDVNIIQLVRDRKSGRIIHGEPVKGNYTPIGYNIIPNHRFGPNWILWKSEKIYKNFALSYVKKIEDEKLPLYIAEFSQWMDIGTNYEQSLAAQFKTRNHGDVYTNQYANGLYLCFVSHEGVTPTLKLYLNDMSIGSMPKQDMKKSTAVMKSLIPGMGQRYKGQKGKGMTFIGLTTVAMGASAYFFNSYTQSANKADAEFNNYVSLNSNINNRQEKSTLLEVQQKMADQRGKWQKAYNDFSSNKGQTIGMACAAVAAGVYIFNLIDASKGFPMMRDADISKHRITLSAPIPHVNFVLGTPVYKLSFNVHF